jgi:hypothetical protein
LIEKVASFFKRDVKWEQFGQNNGFDLGQGSKKIIF